MITLTATLLTFFGLVPATMQNPDFNGSFERATGARPSGWRTQTWGGRADFAMVKEGREGTMCVRIDSPQGADAGWTVQVPVRPFSKYKFSGWIKTDNVRPGDGAGALFNLHSRSDHTEAMTGTSDWKEVGFEFDTGGEDSIQLNCLIGYYGSARGTVWFDDLELKLLSTREPKPQATIDPTVKLEPLSKYVYGQFIEHLGRCIYGGIWSEMLEDRKFLYPVGDRLSPWKAEGGLKTSFAKTEYRELPLLSIEAPGALVQEGLGLRRGVALKGRITGDGSATADLELVDGSAVLSSAKIKLAGNSPKAAAFTLAVPKDSENATLRIRFDGPARLAGVSLMPSDNIRGMRADVIKLLRELDGTIYRWPGGNFVSAYDWRDGLGDPDRRPTRKNLAWQGSDSNDFGLHEFMDFCHEIGTEPEVVVNTGFGDSHSAWEEVQYVNGPANSEWGAKRAKNGRREPWNVRWWAVGNEMFGSWQHGYMALNQYVQKHKDFARKMRMADPTIKLIGVGAAGSWTEGMLRNCSDAMDLVSEHFYCQERPSVMSHVAQMPTQVRNIAMAHREYRDRLANLKGKDIRISLDEWNYWYGPHVYGELGTIYYLKDALGCAAGLHEMYRNSDLYFMANYAQTVNVIGAIKTTKTKAAFDVTGLILREYKKLFGTQPLALKGTPEPLDVMAAKSGDGKTLTIGIVNPMGSAQTLEMGLGGLQTGAGDRYELAGDPQAFNTPDKPTEVVWVKSAQPQPGPRIEVRPYSVTLLILPLRAS